MRLVHGVGFNDKSSIVFKNGKNVLEYKKWLAILERCYSEKLHKRRPTYIGCTVSENFKSYSYFRDWCQKQIGFGRDGFELDKDILVKGNKVYSEDTCVFVPSQINSMMTKTNAKRGDYPIGVSFRKRSNNFVAMHTTNERRSVHIGFFTNANDAFLAYKREREKYIKLVANKYKNDIDPRVYQALMSYEVEITD